MKIKDACDNADIDEIIGKCREYVRNHTDEWYTFKRKGLSDTQNMSRVLLGVLSKSGNCASGEKIEEIMKRMGYK